MDFGYFGPPEEHLEWTEEEREVTYITPEDPSSEIAGEVTATFSAAAMALRETGTADLSHVSVPDVEDEQLSVVTAPENCQQVLFAHKDMLLEASSVPLLRSLLPVVLPLWIPSP